MATSSANSTTRSPVLDYSARDFPSILAEAIQYVKTNYPTRWQDFSINNAGVPLLEAGALMSSILSWNLDSVASETYLSTATQKNSVLALSSNVGYRSQGRTSAIVLCEATLITAANTVPVVLPSGTQIKSLQGEIFETAADVTIAPGNLTPRVAVASEANTAPQGLLLNFIAGATEIHFSLGNSAGHHSLAVEAGMWIASKGQYQQYYQIASLDTAKTVITLAQPFNGVFTGAFVIKTAGNDAASSATIVSAAPFGTFPGTATATLNSTIVTFSRSLPASVLPSHFFRLNGLSSCCGSKWFSIAAIAPDRMSITLSAAFGPTTPNGFDDPNVGFNIQNRSAILAHGSTRTDTFPSVTSNGFQSFQLLSTPVVPSSVRVYDQDGQVDSNGNPLPWTIVKNLSDATFSSVNFRGYDLVEIAEDTYEVRFGNGILGKQPTGVVTVKYRVGGGPVGNVPLNSFNATVSAKRGTDTVSISITNTESYGQGGAYGEDIATLKQNIPAWYATNERAVLDSDYKSLILDGYSSWSNAIGSIYQVSVNKTLNQIPFGGNIIYVNTWTIENFSLPSEVVAGTTYSRLAPPNAALIANVQSYLTSFSMNTDVPTVLKGDVDEGIVIADMQLVPTVDPTTTCAAGELALIALFNSATVVEGQPLLLSDVYGVLEALPGVVQVRMRAMYLDYVDPNQPGNLTITPTNLKTIGDLYPSSLNSIVTPGDIALQVWNANIGLALFVSAAYYPNTLLAQESIRQALENFFFDLRPGSGVLLSDIQTTILSTLAGSVATLAPVLVASSANIALNNPLALTSLSIDGIAMRTGNRVLLFAQTDPSENGVYRIAGLTSASDPYSLVRTSDALNYNQLPPATLIKATSGVTFTGITFIYNTHNLNFTSWDTGAKTFTIGNELNARATITAITTLNSLRFAAPIGTTPDSYPPTPGTVYFMKTVSFS